MDTEPDIQGPYNAAFVQVLCTQSCRLVATHAYDPYAVSQWPTFGLRGKERIGGRGAELLYTLLLWL